MPKRDLQRRIDVKHTIPTSIRLATTSGSTPSALDTKTVVGDPVSADEALEYVLKAARKAVKRFVYKPVRTQGTASLPHGGAEFSGLIVDFAARYGMDVDVSHPNGKHLNIINAIGDLMLAVAALSERVEQLESLTIHQRRLR